ncbi:MAG: UDP-N-acetylglucosamine--N-acetylmuramyl-(pentapeptide) pyrophosphoryl-undecaprenol N-acetylglucosamine transferase [Patescibacteria group bacterium]|nr:UDP-N-acetylglucosamine--N-acetylmuramyl-(pentapeptide) pyrophosphoryl-undecaprenol N-acetylglucosamine transferase [Patescibacteria group bacterium]
MRILFTGGETGGHIYPIIAVAQKIKEKNPEAELYYVGCPENYGYFLAQNKIKVYKIASSKLRRYFDFRNIIDFPKFIISVIQAFWKIFWIMPDVLFSKGGPGALPVVLACYFYRIPIIIHESDAVAGLTNLISAKYADRIAVSFIASQESFLEKFKKEKDKRKISAKMALTGNPIRDFLLRENNLTREAAKKIFSFDPNRPVILVLGGSQGAVRINDFFLDIAKELIVNNYQILHQTGINNFTGFNKEITSLFEHFSQTQKNQYKSIAYFDENIKDAYIAADLVVSRAGSGSIFEIAAMGKPSILLPLAEAAGNHQVKNAFEYSKAGAAIVIEESNLKPNLFMSQIQKIFSNPGISESMSQSAATLFKPQSSQIIADEVLKLTIR